MALLNLPIVSVPVEYRECVGFPGYRVGNDGSVWQGTTRLYGHKQKLYLRVYLHRDGKTVSRRIHVLVLEAFVGSCPPGMEACHYPDPEPTNNALRNLRWDTHAENMKDKYRDLPPVTEKACKRCGIIKPLSEFYPDRRDRQTGRRTLCKVCNNEVCCATIDRERHRVANREYARRQREKKRGGVQ